MAEGSVREKTPRRHSSTDEVEQLLERGNPWRA
jgi:hypothetical protein